MGTLRFKTLKTLFLVFCTLSFNSLLKCLKNNFNKIEDCRDISRIDYILPDVYTSGFAMFYLQDKALLEFQRRFQEQVQKNNLTTVFGVEKIPSDSQFRDLIDCHSYEPILESFEDIFRRLQRGKYLDRYSFLDDFYLITIDGTEYFTSENIYCKKCLRKVSRFSKERNISHNFLKGVHQSIFQILILSN